MRRRYLGEFEEVVFGAVHNTLIRLEEKGFVTSALGWATAERGGRRKRLFTITAAGSRALQYIQQLRSQLWPMVPPHSLQPGGA
jgi:DNA-binding PadR family transcriptional regulator